MVGRLLDGRYRVEERIARGGMATVYRAFDTRLERQVALKIMLPSFAEDPQFVSRFTREARAAARLSDPHVVSVFDQGDDNGIVFLAMEYIPGRTLRDLLSVRGRLNARETVNVMTPVLQALTAAHRSGLVHRDVKPENVLIGDDGRVHVADFGLARAANASASDNATHGVLIGTVAYLAPEQVSPGVSDERSDVYAAGIMMYELLTGKPPFEGTDAMAVAYQHVHDDVPQPSKIAADVPPSLDAVVGAATQRDPAQRPANAAALLALVQGLPTFDQPASDHQPTVVVALPPEATAPTHHTAVTPVGAALAPAAAPAPVSEPPAIKRKRGRGLIALLLVVALAIAAGGFAWSLGSDDNIEVPGVTGLVASEAEARLTAVGLEFAYARPEFSETVPSGEVISSDPEKGASVSDGATVTLTLSKGKERFPVPHVVGKSLQNAKQLLRDRNLAVGKIDHKFSSTVAEGVVINSAPQAKAELTRNTEVDLVVSDGPPPIAVDNVVGKTVGEARSQVENAGLQLRVVEERYDQKVPAGVIISQDPGEGATLFSGGTVNVVVSKGPPLKEVPAVLSRSLEDARTLLSDAGFDVVVNKQCVIFCVGRVVDQNPNGGEQVPVGSTVTITIV
ncbi:MAG: Stk1 family PASTA domain-containing Ser/Thr kinase [Candidatus Nanopelagicales bacterium]